MLTIPILVSSFKSTRLAETRFLGLSQKAPLPSPTPERGKSQNVVGYRVNECGSKFENPT